MSGERGWEGDVDTSKNDVPIDMDIDIDGLPPSPPKSVAEIFECAGTLALLHESGGTKGGGGQSQFSSGLNRRDCQFMALVACGRFLTERLATGIMGVEGEGEAAGRPSAVRAGIIGTGRRGGGEININLADEIPVSFLDGMLESATLFGVSFNDGSSERRDAGTLGGEDDRTLLANFVAENFEAFLQAVRKLPWERGAVSAGREGEGGRGHDTEGGTMESKKGDGETMDDDEEDRTFRAVSAALYHLLRCVRELASGLALPEVGLDVEQASDLVDRAAELTESVVRRRVATKFIALQGRVARECLGPFARGVASMAKAKAAREVRNDDGRGNGEEAPPPPRRTVVDAVRLAHAALSDALQMADDLIRATLQRSSSLGSGGGDDDDADGGAAVVAVVAMPVDSAVIKLAVRKNSRAFAAWLASSLEVLAGCESDDRRTLLEVPDRGEEEDGDDNDDAGDDTPVAAGENDGIVIVSAGLEDEDGEESPVKRGSSSESYLADLVVFLEDEATDAARSDLALAVCEMCRLAERSMAEAMDQSIRSAVDEEARMVGATVEAASGLFEFDDDDDNADPRRLLSQRGSGRKDTLDTDKALSIRFHLAASRALRAYSLLRGTNAAYALCSGLAAMAVDERSRDPDAIPAGPRDGVLVLLEIVKASCADCAAVFGDEAFAAPFPPFPEDQDDYPDAFGAALTRHRGHDGRGIRGEGGPATRGLQLDVERMFVERTRAYSHPSEVTGSFARNSVASRVVRVALASWIEAVRSCPLSPFGYRQVKVDAILLRHAIPHFVIDVVGLKGEASACTSLFNSINDVMLKAGQRCVDQECVGDDEYYDPVTDEIVSPFSIVQRCLSSEYGVEQERVLKRISF